MRPTRQSGSAFAERLFTIGSASAFLALMTAVAWALALPSSLLK